MSIVGWYNPAGRVYDIHPQSLCSGHSVGCSTLANYMLRKKGGPYCDTGHGWSTRLLYSLVVPLYLWLEKAISSRYNAFLYPWLRELPH